MLQDQFIISAYKKRTEILKKKVVSSPFEICLERARLFTESYKKTKGEPQVIRFAKAMEGWISIFIHIT
ncbi:MAG: hypothetical protein ACTSRW_10085 [Candidatus Helarchaeota archaeon]